MTDMLDPASVNWHATNTEMPSWAVTKALTQVRLDRTSGIAVSLSPYSPGKGEDGWPDRTPFGWDGTIRWTLCLAAKINGAWHGAAFQEFWHDRIWTGAPLLTDWSDGWADPRGWAGPELTAYRPVTGDQIALMAVAGQLRMKKEQAAGNTHMLTVRERSNMVVVTLKTDATYMFDGIVPVPPPSVPAGPQTGPAVTTDLSAVLEELKALRAGQAALAAEIAALRVQKYTGSGVVGPFRGSVTLSPN